MSRARPSVSSGSASGVVPPGSVMLHPPALDAEAAAEQGLRHVVGHGLAVTSTCSAPATRPASLLTPALVESSAKHVVKDQHRVIAVVAQKREGPQSQRERQRPRLPAAGIALRREVADLQHDLVAGGPTRLMPRSSRRASGRRCLPARRPGPVRGRRRSLPAARPTVDRWLGRRDGRPGPPRRPRGRPRRGAEPGPRAGSGVARPARRRAWPACRPRCPVSTGSPPGRPRADLSRVLRCFRDLS